MTSSPKSSALRNIVITGASRGMGRAMAEKFGAGGCNLFLCARNTKALAQVCGELQTKFPSIKVFFFAADLSQKIDALNLSLAIKEKFERVDVLINNAGQFIPGSIYNEKEGVLEEMLGVNLYSAYYLTRALLPSMIQNKEGHIFNICSIASLKAYDNGGSYSISKFALMGFSKNLREELKPYNIKVSSVFPGAVYTASWEGSGVSRGRIMEVNDIAMMVYTASLLSPQACVEEIILRPQMGDL